MSRPPVLARAIERGMAPFRGARAHQMLPRTRLGGPMPWVIAIMVALSVVAAGGALAMQNVTQTARDQLAGGATVQIVEADAQVRAVQAKRALELLERDALVVRAVLVPEDELVQLVEPWLGAGAGSQAIPLPALIDVQLRGSVDEEALTALRDRLAEVAPAARIDAQSDWLIPVFDAIDALRYLAFGLIALLAATSAAAVWLAARNALNANRETIEVMHLLGGTDRQVVRIFGRSVLIDAGLGAVAGLMMGTVALLVLGSRFALLDTGFTRMGGLAGPDWLLLALVPLIGVATALLTARITVLASLRNML